MQAPPIKPISVDKCRALTFWSFYDILAIVMESKDLPFVTLDPNRNSVTGERDVILSDDMLLTLIDAKVQKNAKKLDYIIDFIDNVKAYTLAVVGVVAVVWLFRIITN